jgi:hypothetical protein
MATRKESDANTSTSAPARAVVDSPVADSDQRGPAVAVLVLRGIAAHGDSPTAYSLCLGPTRHGIIITDSP